MRKLTFEQRFWNKVHKTDSCWLWTGSTRDGYGQIGKDGKVIRAHRWSYQQANGSIEQTIDLHHTCVNRNCVNPSHLFAVDHSEHSTINRFSIRNGQTVCANGHKLTKGSIRVRIIKTCRECERKREREYRREYRKSSTGR